MAALIRLCVYQISRLQNKNFDTIFKFQNGIFEISSINLKVQKRLQEILNALAFGNDDYEFHLGFTIYVVVLHGVLSEE